MSKSHKTAKDQDVKADLEKEDLETTDTASDEDENVKVENDKSEQQEKENSPEGNETAQDDDELNTKYMRLMADFQNYKRRTEKEKSDIYAYANEKLVSELLDVIDNFERALQHGEGEEGFVQGMNNIFKILKGVLEKSGLEEIEALGVEFDPNFHNAVMTEDSNEYESGFVTAVLQRGYKLNGKVIRPSMVKVAN
ncbi:MAG: nucleotide exchange factor GrpE [Aminipila sp.]